MGRKKRNSAQRSKQSPRAAVDSPVTESSKQSPAAADSPATESATEGAASVASSSGPNETKKATKTPEERRKELEVQMVDTIKLLRDQLKSLTQNKGTATKGAAGVASSSGPAETKKTTKTPEERRKEIEVQVAAARLLQEQSPKTQKNGGAGVASSSGPNETKKATKTVEERRRLLLEQLKSPQTQNKGDRDSRALDSSPGDGQRMGVKRKQGNTRKTGTTTDRSDRVPSYWNIMSNEVKKDLLTIRVGDLKSHFGSSKDTSVNDVLSEALSFAEANKTWKFWLCCSCNEKYSDRETYSKHVALKHVGYLLPKLKALLPQDIDNDWIDMVINCSWKPLDVSASVKLLEQLAKTIDKNTDFSNIAETDNPLADGWPTSDDSQRARLLKKIQTILEVLIALDYLAATHIDQVIQFAKKEIECFAAGSRLLNECIDLSPVCICFLDVPQLKDILKFLQQISYVCDLGRNADKCPSPMGDLQNASEDPEIIENIVLNEDAKCLLLDECLLPTEVLDDGTNVTSPEGDLHSNNLFLSWIYSGSSSGDQLTSWVRYKEDKRKQGLEVIQKLENEFHHLQNLCEKKCEGISYMKALETIQEFCHADAKERQHDTEYVLPGYESVLRKRIEELTVCTQDLMFTGNRFELQVMTYVLDGAEERALKVNQSGSKETYDGATCQIRDLESVEVDGSKMKDDYSETERAEVDSYIEILMEKLKNNLSLERSELDARIMKNIAKVEKWKQKLEDVSAHDYRAILLSLVKLNLRAYLEDLAEKDAREKSDAATEAFLAELTLDSKKVVKGGNENTRRTEKIKDKKKKKKTRDKARGRQEHPSSVPETTSLDQVERDGDHQDSEINVSAGGDGLEQQEEEARLLLELKEQERLLEQALERQRRLENWGEEKDLSHQQEGVGDKLQDAQLSTAAGDPDVNEHADDPDINEHADDPDIHEHADPDINEHADDPDIHEHADDPDIHEHADGPDIHEHADGPDILNLEDLQLSDEHAGKEDVGLDGRETPEVSSMEDDEDDEEETFQADLKEAVSQSLGLASPQEDNFGFTGLKNEAGENNCFLNVIIQSLWHISMFRDGFICIPKSEHNHVGDPCVVCALYQIFTAMYVASKFASVREGVAPTSLRRALSNLHPNSNFFQENQMNDASEVMAVIFDCLHKSFVSGSSEPSDSEPVETNYQGSWDCENPCIVHSLFGMDIFVRMNCRHCGLDSRHMKYTSLFHNINASDLRTIKAMHGESSFGELLNLVEMNNQLACDPAVGGCGNHNHFEHILSTPPRVFIIVLGWQNTFENADDVTATLAALDKEIDISVLYQGLAPESIYRLVSVVCYHRLHYCCFAYSHDHKQWLLCDDITVKVLGESVDVLEICGRKLYQPQVLFFEAVTDG